MIAPVHAASPAALPSLAPACAAPSRAASSRATASRATASRATPLLMCSPRLYTVNYVINPWMSGNIGAASQARAMAQWTRLFETLSGLTDVHLIDPVAGSPDMVFTANAGLVGSGVVALSSFLCPERQGEEPHFRRWFEEAGYKVVDLPRETPFEGEGDALFSADGSRLWAGYGTRTAAASHGALRVLSDAEVVSLRLVDARFYHLDTCFAPLSDGSVMYVPAAFSPESRGAIEAFYGPGERIAVSEADALCFACNAVNLGEDLVLNHVSPGLERSLRDRGFRVTQLPLDEFLKAGGAAKCLVMKLSPEMHPAVVAGGASDAAARQQTGQKAGRA